MLWSESCVLSSLGSYIEVLTPPVWCLEVIRFRWGHEGGAPMGGECPYKERKTWELTLSLIWGYSQKVAVCKPGSGLSPETKSVSSLILGFPVCTTMRYKFLTYVFISPAYTSRSRIVGSYGNSMVNFFEEWPDCSLLSLYHFTFLQVMEEGSNFSTFFVVLFSISPHSFVVVFNCSTFFFLLLFSVAPDCQCLSLSVLLTIIILKGVTVVSHCSFDLNFLMATDVKYPFSGLLTICISPWEKLLFRSFAHFKTGLSVYCWNVLLPSRVSSVRLWDPIDGSPPGSAIPGILQARVLEWVAIRVEMSIII